MHNSDYIMVIGCLRGASPRENSCYLRRMMRLSLRQTSRQTKMRVEKIFSELRCAVPKLYKETVCHNS